MRNKVLYLQLCLLFIISSLPVQKAQAGEKDTPTEYNTPIYGEWSTKVRSLSPIPFTASISGDQLTLKCTSPDYDINITIVNANGQPVWQRDIAAPETSFVSHSSRQLTSR